MSVYVSNPFCPWCGAGQEELLTPSKHPRYRPCRCDGFVHSVREWLTCNSHCGHSPSKRPYIPIVLCSDCQDVIDARPKA